MRHRNFHRPLAQPRVSRCRNRTYARGRATITTLVQLEPSNNMRNQPKHYILLLHVGSTQLQRQTFPKHSIPTTMLEPK